MPCTPSSLAPYSSLKALLKNVSTHLTACANTVPTDPHGRSLLAGSDCTCMFPGYCSQPRPQGLSASPHKRLTNNPWLLQGWIAQLKACTFLMASATMLCQHRCPSLLHSSPVQALSKQKLLLGVRRKGDRVTSPGVAGPDRVQIMTMLIRWGYLVQFHMA